MALWQGKSKRRSTGGRISPHRGKKRSEIGRELQQAKVGSLTKKVARARGGGRKDRLLVLTMPQLQIQNQVVPLILK